MPMRRLLAVVIGTAALVSVASGTANATAFQFGRYMGYTSPDTCCGGQYLDGIWFYAEPVTESPNQYNCILMDAVIEEIPVSLQIETGSLRCGPNSPLDGNPVCSNSWSSAAALYDEEWYGGNNYQCENDGSQALSSTVSYSARLYQLSGGYFGAYLGGHRYNDQSGYNSNYVTAYDWDEASGATPSCDATWQADGYSSYVQFYNRNTGFTDVPDTPLYFLSYKYPSTCGHVSTYLSGTFEAYHQDPTPGEMRRGP
jgi:hypothetical protein